VHYNVQLNTATANSGFIFFKGTWRFNKAGTSNLKSRAKLHGIAIPPEGTASQRHNTAVVVY
jgi:hypothetical protein